jgi:Bacterial TniB protein
MCPTARFYELEHAAITLLTHANPRILIIDEIQHLLSCSAREQRAALNMVKFLSNDRRISVVAAGTHEALHVMRFDPQIASRFEQMELPVWTESDELRRFVAGYLAMLPIRKNPSSCGTLSSKSHSLGVSASQTRAGSWKSATRPSARGHRRRSGR